MNTFFDLREFLIAVLKKAKLTIILTLILTVLGGALRFIPLVLDYINYDNVTVEDAMEGTDDYPYWYQSRRTLFINPDWEIIGDNIVDHAEDIVDAYLACLMNKEIFQPLIDEYYVDVARLYNANQEAQIKYQFITSSMSRDFMITNFYPLFEIRTVGSHFVSLYVKTPDEQLSEVIVERWEELSNEYIKTLLDEYDYSITEGQVGVSLPQVQTSGEIKPQTSQVIRPRVELSYIVSRSIKGGIWGFGGGILLSIFLAFFTYSVSTKVNYESDLDEYGIPTLGVIRGSKKKRIKWIEKIVDSLEGNTSYCESYQDAAKLIAEYIRCKTSKNTSKILLTGEAQIENILDISKSCKDLLADQEDQYIICDGKSLVTSGDTIKLCREADHIVLVEEVGVSNKEAIKKSIKVLQTMEKDILGIVLIK